jgi:hypothetical protein
MGKRVAVLHSLPEDRNDISKAVYDTIDEQLKKLGTDGKVIIRVLEIYVRPTGSLM